MVHIIVRFLTVCVNRLIQGGERSLFVLKPPTPRCPHPSLLTTHTLFGGLRNNKNVKNKQNQTQIEFISWHESRARTAAWCFSRQGWLVSRRCIAEGGEIGRVDVRRSTLDKPLDVLDVGIHDSLVGDEA